MVHEGFLQAGDLLQAQHLIQIHPELGAYFFIGPAGTGEIHDNGAHGAYAVGPSGTVMPDGGGDPLIQGLVQGGDGEVAVYPVADIRIFPGDSVAVEAVYDFPGSVLHVIGNDRHGIAILPDTGMQKLHFRGGYIVGIVFVCLDGFLPDPEDTVRGFPQEGADLGYAVPDPVDGFHLFVQIFYGRNHLLYFFYQVVDIHSVSFCSWLCGGVNRSVFSGILRG